MIEINREETIELLEAKKTTGGYLGKLFSKIAHISFQMKLEISLRDRKRTKGEVLTIDSQFLPPFTIYVVKRDKLIKGKINALLSRTKPKDYYDLYFILRKFLNLKVSQPETKKILSKVKRLDSSTILRDLRPLLPKSHHMILKNFKENLLRELARFSG